MTEPELPEARVVDPDAGRRMARRVASHIGLGLVGATLSMWAMLIGGWALGSVIVRVIDGRAPGLYDLGALAVLGLVGFVMVRRIVRPSILELRHARSGRLEYPSTSWVHAVFDVLWGLFGVVFLASYQPEIQGDIGLGIGLGFTIFAGSLLALRIVFHRRMYDLP